MPKGRSTNKPSSQNFSASKGITESDKPEHNRSKVLAPKIAWLLRVTP
jgi:hypothetical protein